TAAQLAAGARACIRVRPSRVGTYDGEIAGSAGTGRVGAWIVVTEILVWAFRQQFLVLGRIPGLAEVIGLVKLVISHEWQYKHSPTMHRLPILIGDECWRIPPERRTIAF